MCCRSSRTRRVSCRRQGDIDKTWRFVPTSDMPRWDAYQGPAPTQQAGKQACLRLSKLSVHNSKANCKRSLCPPYLRQLSGQRVEPRPQAVAPQAAAGRQRSSTLHPGRQASTAILAGCMVRGEHSRHCTVPSTAGTPHHSSFRAVSWLMLGGRRSRPRLTRCSSCICGNKQMQAPSRAWDGDSRWVDVLSKAACTASTRRQKQALTGTAAPQASSSPALAPARPSLQGRLAARRAAHCGRCTALPDAGSAGAGGA